MNGIKTADYPRDLNPIQPPDLNLHWNAKINQVYGTR